MRRFDLGDNWAYRPRCENNRAYGMSDSGLRQLYRDAALITNFHGCTVPLPEHYATGRLIYLETDPVDFEIDLYHNEPRAIAFLEPHIAFFTWGLNYGQPDCAVPLPAKIRFHTTPPAVVPELWPLANTPGPHFTTVGNWRQRGQVEYRGEIYTWSKHYEFLKFLDLPQRTGQSFELALSSSSMEAGDESLLTSSGWRVTDALEFSGDLDAYRRYIGGSRGEFTVAKDQNVRLRSGWFSERSAQYLASGKPVITQETGFSNILPTDRGLFAFSTLEDAAAAVEEINSDYKAHSRSARDICQEYFDSDKVLKRFLDDLGI